MYELEILHHYGKRTKTKSQKVLAAIFYVCRSSRGKTGQDTFLPPLLCPTPASWIGLKRNKNFRLADNHISVKKIREYFPNIIYGDFDFTEVSFENVKKEMLNLNIKKSSTNVSSPATVLRQTAELHLSFLTKTINKSYAYEKWSLKKKTLQGRRTTELIITRFTGFQKKNLQTNN